jgi:chromosomal replication initiator protein
MEQVILDSSADQQRSDVEAVWQQCLEIIKDNIAYRTFQTWFEPILAVSLDGQVLTLQVPSQFFYEWLEEHYVDLLGKTIKRILGKNARLEYRIMMEGTGGKRQPASINIPGSTYTRPSKDTNYVDVGLQQHDDPSGIKSPYAIPGIKRVQIDPQLNPNYSFENFVQGDCNRLARGAGLSVAQKPGATSFNPMVVFGSNGWGKTHLVQAIGNEVRRLHPNKSVLYVSAEKFINQFVDHSKNNEVNDFIHFYQLIDVLILDDIHLFVPALKTQDVFFAIFNHLHQSGKQIILTSDTSPRDMEGIQERLLSRFRWGLNADITAPDFATRKEILKLKMRREGLQIPEEVVSYVAYNVQQNVRELEGAVIALYAQATLNNKEIDLDLARQVMKNFIKTAERQLTIENIQKMVVEFYDLPYESLQEKTRKQEIVQARQVTMYLAKKFTKMSLKAIGTHFGGYDHTTVLHSCKQVKNQMDINQEYKAAVLQLQQKVQLASM